MNCIYCEDGKRLSPGWKCDICGRLARDSRPAAGSAVWVIDLDRKESECCICGKPLYDARKGIAMYEGCAVPHQWTGEWGGQDACAECFDKHERGELPTWPYPPNTD